MLIFKRKQIVILALILMIVVAGYLQYSYRQGSTSAEMDGILGDAVYVDSEIENEGLTGSEVGAGDKNIKASKMADNYFVEAKIEKEQSRGRNSESLKAITEDINASQETKDDAYGKMIALTENSEKEMRIETLIDKMGFEETFVLFADSGSVDIVVKAPSLSTAQAAQIMDIVMRQGDVEVEDIHIKPMF